MLFNSPDKPTVVFGKERQMFVSGPKPQVSIICWYKATSLGEAGRPAALRRQGNVLHYAEDTAEPSVLVDTPARCPECGGQLTRAGLCFACISCGWGACSG